jgi:hypothetical protein
VIDNNVIAKAPTAVASVTSLRTAGRRPGASRSDVRPPGDLQHGQPADAQEEEQRERPEQVELFLHGE